MLRSWKARALGLVGLVFVVVVGAGVFYFFLRSEPEHLKLVQPAAAASTPAGASPAATTGGVSSTASTTATTPAGAIRYIIDPARSEVAYFAGEKLASLPTNSVAKGTTKEISGEFFIGARGLDATRESKFTVDLRNLTTDESRRDLRVQLTLETQKFPTAVFTVTKLDGFPPELPPGGSGAQFKMTGQMEVHGVKKEVTWTVVALSDGTTFSALAKVKIRYDDFGVVPPSIGDFVSVEDDLQLEIQVIAVNAGAPAN